MNDFLYYAHVGAGFVIKMVGLILFSPILIPLFLIGIIVDSLTE